MDRQYKHLNGEERGVIFAEHRRGTSLRTIGSLLGRHASTISRELRRGRGDDGRYSPESGRRGYDTRRLRSRRARRLIEGSALHIWVRGKLVHLQWSPEQIAGKLRAMHPDDPDQRVSHETIYTAIYAQPRGGLKAAMIEALRQRKPSRGRRRATLAGTSMVPESLRIIHRPEEIEARIVPGHWEGDLIKGAFNRSSLMHCFAMHCRQVIAFAITERWARWLSAKPASLFFAGWMEIRLRRRWRASVGR